MTVFLSKLTESTLQLEAGAGRHQQDTRPNCGTIAYGDRRAAKAVANLKSALPDPVSCEGLRLVGLVATRRSPADSPSKQP